MLSLRIVLLFLVMLSGCTLSLQNISTHGTATDLVDDELSTTPRVQIKPTIPLIK